MKIQIDLKSILCGLIVGVAAMFVMGADSSSNESARYQISSGTTGTVMVDTKTGQAWAYAATMLRNDAGFFDAKNK